MKGRKFKEVMTKGRIELIYTVLYTYERLGDKELIAVCNRTINNIISLDGRHIIPNDCGQGTIAVSNLKQFQEI
jgi:hypothetical protein